MDLNTTLIITGVIALFAAILGGGLKALGFEIPVLQSTRRQILLAAFGTVLIAWGMAVEPVKKRAEPAQVTDREPATKPPVTYEEGVDRWGDDLYPIPIVMPRDDAMLCATACMQDPRCKAFTYVRPNTIRGPTGECFLKSGPGVVRSHVCCISGLKIAR